jgi:hypothetical protein
MRKKVLDPITLTEDIIDLAKAWCDECWNQRAARWSEPHRHFVAEAALTSPVDGGERKVTLFISQGFGDRIEALTCPPGSRDKLGRSLAKEGYFAILTHVDIAFLRPRILPVLLHELTHVVDPMFLEDCARRKAWVPVDSMSNALRQYALPSEQRAFTAMWIDELKRHLARGTIDLDWFIHAMRCGCKNFSALCDYGPEVVPNLMEQIRDHFAKIAAHLMRLSAPPCAVPGG